jgi:hypothetical protein
LLSTTDSVITDASGNLAYQSVATFVPSYDQTVSAGYAGDLNYHGASSQIAIAITDGTFSMGPIANASVKQGFATTAPFTIIPAKGFAGPISISCSLPTNMKEASCPTIDVNLPTSDPVQTYAIISTTAPHPIGTSPRTYAGLYSLGLLSGLFLLAMPGMRARNTVMLMLAVLLGFLVISCGGGGGSGNSGGGPQMDPGTPKGTYSVSLTATGGGVTQTATFNVMVQ